MNDQSTERTFGSVVEDQSRIQNFYNVEAEGANLSVQSKDLELYFTLTYLGVAWEILKENYWHQSYTAPPCLSLPDPW